MTHRGGGSSAPAFLLGGGAAGAALRALPWDATGLGQPVDWGPTLRSVVALCLHAAVPTALFWGEQFRLLFGDAWAPLLGPGAASAMAQPAEHALPGLWPILGPQLRRALDGAGVSAEEVAVPLPGGGDSFWTYSFSPVLDSAGRRLGVLATVSDVSDQVLTRRRQDAIIELGDRFAGLGDAEDIVRLGCEVIGRTLGVARVGRGIVDEAAGVVRVSGSWCNGLPNPDGTHDLARFWDDWTVAGPEPTSATVEDVSADPRLAGRADGFRTRGVGAFMTAPVLEKGRVRLLTFVHSTTPRRWRASDLTFVRDVVSRGRAAAERARAQAALRESDTRNRHSVALSPLFMWTADADGRLDHVDERLVWRTGRAGLGDSWVKALHPHDRAPTVAAWRNAVERGAGYDIEHRIILAANRIADPAGHGFRWMRSRANPQRDGTGRVVKWYGLTEDTQDIVEAREVLARSRAEMERRAAELAADRDRMWRSSTDLMAILRLDGTVVAVNPAWQRVFGWTPQQLLGQSLAELVHEDDRRLVDAAFARLHRGEVVEPVESRLRGKDDAFRVLSWTAVPASGLVHAIGRDNTAERAAAAELLAAQDTLRQAQKMEAVGQLTGGIAHDFNNMLAVVVGSLDLLGRRIGAGDERASRYVANAMEGARRAAALTNRLLAFSRQQTLSPVVVDIRALLAGMTEWLGASLGASVRLEVESGELWPVLADHNQLENAVLNLALNARDAMAGGGRLRIETANVVVRPGDSVPPGDYVRILVSDTGPGIAPEVIGRVFDPFFTTKEIGKGTGLGLSQVYGFVTQSGGHVGISSAPGAGATVSIHLPRHRAGTTVAPGSAASPTCMPVAAPGTAVLVVEDEPAVRRFTADAMAQLGYRVMEADGAAPALALLDGTEDVRLLFTDVVMPDIDGRLLAAEAQRRRPGLRVLFTSGLAPGNDVGGTVLFKPFTVDQLAVAVRGALA